MNDRTGTAMKKSIKAALYSGLLFPGTGHFSLKRYLRGLIFFVPATTALLIIANNSIQKALAIVDKIEQGAIPLDVQTISNLVSAAPTGAELYMLSAAQWIIAGCWIISIVDSYRLGKIADQSIPAEHP